MSSFDHLRDELTLAGPADPRQLARLRQDHGPQMPVEYLSFLAAHDGAEGAVGALSPAPEVGRGEDIHPELDHLHGLVIFGSDGGNEAFAFDEEGRVVVIPWIGGCEDAVPQGTFFEFLTRLVESRLFERGS
jgi:hypothetical protein